ncbi:NAD(P)/FAD-dependent oxidoreductase [Tessaracoccus palaemonis]|uniref:NAD(P)/FAD-dependent oxidoreductase n=1 Tax=Tessaracoccus palaemonis TaxID=2829499 RepID=A0ABX8SE84_9ACTN|nr:NAD(P)/FAD-dependent oxidoreductase [Tessaracoccus palaemonis]QXT61616.1 NAD(P)/FAD-dependent oxidoreductase [Tessaracoccus palaemonis]
MDTQHSSAVWDSIVVGGGAAGLSAAMMLGRAGRHVLVIDAGSPRNRFAAHMHGVLGHDGRSPLDLVRAGREEVAAYGVRFLDGVVATVGDGPDGVTVTTHTGQELRARTLIVATGLTDVLPEVPGPADRWGMDVLHCPYCHGWEVRGQRIGVLATSPMSLHQVRMVRQWTDDLVYFAAGAGPLGPADRQRLAARGIEVIDSPVTGIVVADDALTGVRTADGRTTAVSALFTAAPPRPHDGVLDGLDLARAEPMPGAEMTIAVDATGRTSHPRIWAVGNVVAPGANVPMVMGAASFTGGAVNGWLVEDDFDLAVAGRVVEHFDRLSTGPVETP